MPICEMVRQDIGLASPSFMAKMGCNWVYLESLIVKFLSKPKRGELQVFLGDPRHPNIHHAMYGIICRTVLRLPMSVNPR